ncbi:BrnA antitoxin family protein [Lysobacter sp. GX 14042]|uniref:BrnA antitoxin family protein n=1 Tax=Lysobacter sp. GX 14042 TaxID=2907155 RepID=UPI001F17F562|nr:BrnA antitoxin family protein [Lysobacter sp. GX 14042]MCE7031176.1 BrnA antitoxin family protein [Lysobacter sp. GX 14042]
MNENRTTEDTRNTDVPYDPGNETDTREYWEGATAHKGVAEFRARRGRPPKAADARKEQIALRVDKEVLEWYRAQGPGWQTRMNAVLKAYRDAAL